MNETSFIALVRASDNGFVLEGLRMILSVTRNRKKSWNSVASWKLLTYESPSLHLIYGKLMPQ
jgi:hypothetical protein